MGAPAISVIVPARNAAATIGRAAAAIAAQKVEGGLELIVVDDGSTDATARIAEEAGAKVLRGPALGPGAARNRGAAGAAAPRLAFTDADCFPAPGWAAVGLEALRRVDLVQGAVLPDPTVTRRPFDHTIWVLEESGLYETANLFVRTELFERVGGFEDWLEVDIGKRLGEDVWFGWKARRLGARTTFCAEALVHHAVLPRRWFEMVAERRRLTYFPDLVRKMPELRRRPLTARIFLSPRSAAFVAAATGTLVGAGGRGRGRWLSSLAAAPYLWLLARRAAHLGRYGPRVTLVEVAADLVGFTAMVAGSLRTRTPVL